MSSPSKWEDIKRVANNFYAQGRYEEARREYTRAIQHCPDQSLLFTNRALTYLKQNMIPEAHSDALRATELNSNSFKGYYVLGRCHTANEEYALAVKAFKRCLDMVNEHDPSMSLYNEIFKHYFHARRTFYTQRRQESLRSLRSAVDASKEISCDNNTRASVIEQLYSTIEESNRVGPEHGTVLRTHGAGAGKSFDFFHGIPDCFLCPISLEVMRDPVMVIGAANPSTMCSKQSYEREVIAKHFMVNGPVDPLSRCEYRPQPTLVPNLSLRNTIHCFLEAHPWLYDE